MLKRRIIPIQLLLGHRLVKTLRFGTHRDVGDPVASSKVYSAQNADELIFLNIDRDQRNIHALLRVISRVSEVCFMPLTLGGGIRSVGEAEQLIRGGADKIVLNTAPYRHPQLVTDIARIYGRQAVVASIDVRREGDGYVLYSDCGRRREQAGLLEHLATLQDAGAGEILINAIDRDGVMAGYDLDLVRIVAERCSVPVIACGGAGTFEHLKDVFLETKASAAACGSLFNFGDNNPMRAKAFLANHGLSFKRI